MNRLDESIEGLQKRIDFFRESGRPVPALLEACLIRKKHKQKTGKKLKSKILPWYSRKAMIRSVQ